MSWATPGGVGAQEKNPTPLEVSSVKLAGPNGDFTLKRGQRAWADGVLVPPGFLEDRDRRWRLKVEDLERTLDQVEDELREAALLLVLVQRQRNQALDDSQAARAALDESLEASRVLQVRVRGLEGEVETLRRRPEWWELAAAGGVALVVGFGVGAGWVASR